MSVDLKRNSRLRFADYITIDGDEFFDLLDQPDLPVQTDDLRYDTKDGDRLDMIAHRYYGDPVLWWVIAAANGLEDVPTQLNGNMTLRIPSPRFVNQKLFSKAV